MKKLFGLSMLALSIMGCNSGSATSGSNETTLNALTSMQVKELKDSLNALQDSLTLDSFKRAEAAHAIANEKPKKSSHSRNANNKSNTVSNHYVSEPASVQKKKGWSDAAKGTAIGAGVGAGVGAIIDKDKRGRGAAIGAAIGGGSGYAIGRKSDRESGRVQKK